MKIFLLLNLLIFSLLSCQPIVYSLYPQDASWLSGGYTTKKFICQPLNPLDEIVRVRIVDTTSDSIYFKPIPIRYFWSDSAARRYLCSFCDPDSAPECPCSVIVGYEFAMGIYLSNRIDESWELPYSLSPCSVYRYTPSTTLVFNVSNNIHLERVDTHTWDLYFGIWNKNSYFILPTDDATFAEICNERDECTEFFLTAVFLPSVWGRKPNYKLEYYPKSGTTYTNYLPGSIWCDVSMSASWIFNYYLALDSTSAWFIIRFYTTTGDTFVDTVRYGDPGTFWIVPPGKHIGWRRFGVMTMYTDIPSRGYTGVVEVCLMDVTNAPVIAFGEPTHLHPEGVSCYEDWVYVDSITGDTTVIPDIIPAPPEPVCWRFGIRSEVSEAEREESRFNLEVVGGYLSPIQVFYKIPANGMLELYDITGKVILRRQISAKGSEKIAINGLRSGVYFVRIVGGGKSVVRKVVVVR